MLFIFSKIIGFLLNPQNIIFLLSILLSLTVIIRLSKLSKVISILIVTLSIFFSYLPFSYNLLRNLENFSYDNNAGYNVLKKDTSNFIKYNKEESYNLLDGILVLGGGTGSGFVSEYRNEALLSGSAERLTKAVEIFQKNNSIKIIYSGYSGEIFLKGWPEYKVAGKFFTDMGVSEKNLILEKKSRNTFENILYSKNFINEKETWGLITSAYHMKRANLVINKLNIDNKIILIPVDFQTAGSIGVFEFNFFQGMKNWSIVLHEYVGIIFYYFFR